MELPETFEVTLRGGKASTKKLSQDVNTTRDTSAIGEVVSVGARLNANERRVVGWVSVKFARLCSAKAKAK
jgi:hypothetical protein